MRRSGEEDATREGKAARIRRELAAKRERELTALQEALLAWYEKHARDLPWRRTRDPYHILVSEVMLQQTQVERVIPKYEAFLERFSTLKHLAEAPTGDLLAAWKGLGYHRRALNLRKTAQVILKEYNGRFPQTPGELEKLPGIGAYTAAAIASFAFNHPVAVYDTNVRRVLARMSGVHDEAFLRELASRILPVEKSRVWNNAIMELGSLVCMKQPQCTACPLRAWCYAVHVKDYRTPPVPRQSKYEGSWRQYRARLLHALLEGPLPVEGVRERLQLPAAYDAERLMHELEREGFVRIEDGLVRLA